MAAGFIWFRQDCADVESPELAAFANALGVAAPTALGHLTFLKAWLTKRRPLGDVAAVDAGELARGARYHGDPKTFVTALERAGLINDRGLLLGWKEQNEAIFAKALRDRGPKPSKTGLPQLPGTGDSYSDKNGRRPNPRGGSAGSATTLVNCLSDQNYKEQSPRGGSADSSDLSRLIDEAKADAAQAAVFGRVLDPAAE